MKRKLKVILTGATGMVGEGVLHECLLHPDVEKVLVINRRPGGILHEKLTEVIHEDFTNLTPIENSLIEYNTCFYCLGVSAINMKEDLYRSLTYDLTLDFAQKILSLNSYFSFCYVSGAGTDSSENGKQMWARIKGKTENELLNLPFKQAYMFRPGYLQPTKGLKNHQTFYSLFGFLFPILRIFFPRYVSTLKELGLAMINITTSLPEKQILEVPDIVEWAKP
ncbi:epimerase [Reichenbachiella sp.]|uniref:epimerase n=1 Tax=Reichenbachiella sp. TaxID=2184521 RepID=UPI003B5ADDF9